MVRLDHLCLALILWHLPDVNMQDCPNNFGPETDSRIQMVPGKRGEPGTVDYGKVGEMIQEAQDPALAKIRDDISTMSGRVDRLSDKQGMEDLRSDINVLNERIRITPSFKEIRELEKEVEDLENKLMTEIKTKIKEMSDMIKAETSASSKVSGTAAEIKKVPQVVDDFVEKRILELSNKFEIDMKSELRESSRELEASCDKKMEKMAKKFDSDLAKLNEKFDRLQLTTPSTTARKPDPKPPTTPEPVKSRERNREPTPPHKPVKTTTYVEPQNRITQYTSRYELTFFMSKRNWQDAKDDCVSRGARLVKIDESSITEVIEKNINVSYSVGYWIGATDKDEEGRWFWTDGAMALGQGSRYTNWYEWEPNNKNNEDCASVGRYSMQWVDAQCNLQFYYICQRDAIKLWNHRLIFRKFPPDSRKDFRSSRDGCAGDNQRLVKISSREMNNEIKEQACLSGAFWSGGEYSATERDWTWIDGEKIWPSFWSTPPQKPYNNKCIAVNSCTWDDMYCSNELNYVCEQVGVGISTSPATLGSGEKAFQIKCSASGLPSPTVSWMKSSSHITIGHQSNTVFQVYDARSSTLHFRNINISMDGQYKCMARNAVSSGNKDIHFEVPGTPTIDFVDPQPCNSSLLVRWTPSIYAYGFVHKIYYSKLSDTVDTLVTEFRPNSGNQRVLLNNLSPWTEYIMKIEVQDYPTFATSKKAITAGVAKPVSLANMERHKSTGSCVVHWSPPNLTAHNYIEFYKVTVKSWSIKSRNPSGVYITVSHIPSSNTWYTFPTASNRNYTVDVTAKTCAGDGDPMTATGLCQTELAAPAAIALPQISDQANEDGTWDLAFEAPDESNGIISCLFVIVTPANIDERIDFTIEILNEANSSSTIAIAADLTSFPLTPLYKYRLGSGKKTTCYPYETGSSSKGRKQEAVTAAAYVGVSSKPKDNKQYSVFVVSSTPTDDGQLFFGRSPSKTINPKSEPATSECPTRQVDLLFVLDGSESVGTGNFNKVKAWVKTVAGKFDLKDCAQVGVIQYSHWFEYSEIDQPFMKTEIELGRWRNQTDFETAVDKIILQGYTTFTAHAINKTVSDFMKSDRFNDSQTKKVMIILTDGRSNDAADLPSSAAYARSLGITIFGVGVAGFSEKELQIIATGEVGNNQRVFGLVTFSDLQKIVQELTQSINRI